MFNANKPLIEFPTNVKNYVVKDFRPTTGAKTNFITAESHNQPIIRRSLPLAKILGKKAKVTIKVTQLRCLLPWELNSFLKSLKQGKNPQILNEFSFIV